MRLLVLRSSWGLQGLKIAPRAALRSVRESGFDGIEASLTDIGDDRAARTALVAAARSEGLKLILSAYSSWHNYEGAFDGRLSPSGHASNLTAELKQIAELHAGEAMSPIIGINAHSGSDAWCEAEQHEFFGERVQASHTELAQHVPSVSLRRTAQPRPFPPGRRGAPPDRPARGLSATAVPRDASRPCPLLPVCHRAPRPCAAKTAAHR